MKRIISFILIFSIFLSSVIVIPNKSYAEKIMDYQDLTNQLREDYKIDFKTPTAKFNVYVNNQFAGVAEPDGSEYENMVRIPMSPISCKVGDSIRVTDVSEVGSGSSIVKRDWQIGMGHNGSSYTGGYHHYSSSSVEFKADKPGVYVVFLNVADNYSGIPNFQNWSEDGNWRTEVVPPLNYPGVTIKGWYFTAFKFEVRDKDSGDIDVDFDIYHNGQNKTDGNILTKSTNVTLNLQDKIRSDVEISKREWSIYNFKTGNYERFSGEKNPSRQINLDSQYVSPAGDTSFMLKATDTRGKIGQAVHKVNIQAETSVKVSARIIAPEYNGDDEGEVDGTFRFTTTSELYDLKSFRIIEGTGYINGSTTGTLSGKKDEKELSIKIPIKKQISISVEVTDVKGNKAVGTASHIITPNRPPYTFISGRNPLYPRVATQTGEYKNLITWSYFDPDNDEMVGTIYEVYKKTGEDEDDWEEIAGDSIPTSGMSEEEKAKARSTILEGDPGEEFEVRAIVHDGKEPSKEASRKFVVDTPYPDFELIVPEYQYIREDVEIKLDDNIDGYPNKFFPMEYTEWSITENNTGRVIKKGTGRIIDKIFTEWEETPKGEKLNGGFYEGNYYTFKQTAKNIFGTTTKEKHLYIVPVPEPKIWITEVYTLINEKVKTESYINQPPVENRFQYGLPEYEATFDETNSNFKIYDPESNKIIYEGKGLFKTFDVNRDKGFIDSIDKNVVYKIEQYAENDKCKFSTFITDLTILQTPEPTVLIGTEDTYIDEKVAVDPHGVEEINNIKKRPKNYKDFQEIYDNFKTDYNDTNAKWTIHEVDFYGNVIKEVEKGTGIKKEIDVFRPKYDETKFYIIKQEVTNRLGVTRNNSSFFAVLTALPPTVTVEILERDDDPLTAKDEIYPRESLDIKTEIIDNKFKIIDSWWEIKNIKTDQVIMSGKGKIQGLKKMNLPIGDYKIVQYAKNSKDKVGEGFTTFKVKPVLPPIIDVIDTNLVVHDDNNTLYMGDILKVKLKVYDINKSEEHPKGYELLKSYALRDKYTNVVFKENGVVNIERVVDRSIFKQGMNYNLNQFAQNIEFPDISSTLTMKFKIDNKKPIVELDIKEGDGIPPLFTGEDILIDVTAKDLDGTIDKVDYYINNIKVKETPTFVLKNFTEKGVGTSLYTAKLHYVGTKREDISFKAVAYDDYGEKDFAVANLYISNPEIKTIIKIEDEQHIRKKENRYIEFSLKDSYTNASIYPLNFEGATTQYQKDNGKWIDISEAENFSDENIRIYYPNYPDKKTISSYFKNPGNYKLRAIVPNSRGEKGEWGYKDISIEKDLAPIADFSLISPYHRITESYIELNDSLSSVVNAENIGKSFFIFDDKGGSPDNDKIEYKKIEVNYDPLQDKTKLIKSVTNILENASSGQEKNEEIVLELGKNKTLLVKDIQAFNITYLTGLDELGNYEFKYTVKEEITQLPRDKNNPLYNEIKGLAKSTTSDPLNVVVDNIAPILKIEITGSETVNLIIHFDRQPTEKENEKIEEIIRNLEKKGIKVNVIKEYGRY